MLRRADLSKWRVTYRIDVHTHTFLCCTGSIAFKAARKPIRYCVYIALNSWTSRSSLLTCRCNTTLVAHYQITEKRHSNCQCYNRSLITDDPVKQRNFCPLQIICCVELYFEGIKCFLKSEKKKAAKKNCERKLPKINDDISERTFAWPFRAP